MNFTQMQMAMFNKRDYELSVADPNYVPRLYQMRPGEKIFRSDTDAEVMRFNSHIKEITPTQLASRNAAVSTLYPDNAWISDAFLKGLWKSDNLSRPTSGRPFSIDGLLYSPNAVMMIAKGTNRAARYNGEILLRGGIVTADVGILGTAVGGTYGFNLLWDERVSDFLSIRDVGNMQLARGLKIIGN